MQESKAIIVFSRVPEKGQVKKRLSKALGAEKAFHIFRLLFDMCLHELAPLDVVRISCLSSTSSRLDAMKLHSMWPILCEFEIVMQRGRDLGERMKNAFSHVFSQGICSAVLVGTDCPELKRHHVVRAFELLENGYLPIGPCEDGGYYLIGLESNYNGWDSLFEDIPWGSSTVLDNTLKRMSELDLEPKYLETLYDIDVRDDYIRWIKAQTTPLRSTIE